MRSNPALALVSIRLITAITCSAEVSLPVVPYWASSSDRYETSRNSLSTASRSISASPVGKKHVEPKSRDSVALASDVRMKIQSICRFARRISMPGESPAQYWRGVRSDGEPRYDLRRRNTTQRFGKRGSL
jgi:hypothetical protein